MASIENRPNGTTRVKWRFEGRQQSVTVDSPRDAKMVAAWLDRNGVRPASDPDLMFALGREAKPSTLAAPVTVGEALDRMTARPGLSDGTRKRYRTNRKQLAAIDDVSVHGLTRVDVESVMATLQARYRESTWRGAAVALQTALRPYGKADLCSGYTGQVSTRHRDPVVMTKATMDLVVVIGHDHGIGDLLAIMADMGLRYGEATAVDREHCELLGSAPEYRVREQFPAVTRAKGITPDPQPLKTKRARREVPMSPRLVDLAERTPSGLLTRDGYDGRGPWRYDVANYRLSRVSRDAIAEGLLSRPVHFHDFRHSWGAHLLTGGVDLVTVSRLMGHASVKVTGDTYGHLTAQGLDAARMLLK